MFSIFMMIDYIIVRPLYEKQYFVNKSIYREIKVRRDFVNIIQNLIYNLEGRQSVECKVRV